MSAPSSQPIEPRSRPGRPVHWRVRRQRRRRAAFASYVPAATEWEGEVARPRGRWSAVRHALDRGREQAAVQLALRRGIHDRNRLADLVFGARHPELRGRRLRPHERTLIREWLYIRTHVVAPALARAAEPPGGGAAGAFVPVPVEEPGGDRIRDKRDPGKLVTVSGVGGRQVPLHRLAAAAWSALVGEARAAGIAAPLLLPGSGYRSSQHQARLFERAVKRYGSREAASRWVAPPGGSAHQSGRAIDFYLGGVNDSANVARLRELPAYRWLAANARRFGFYPYEREPWHWEYNPPARAAGEMVAAPIGQSEPGWPRETVP